MSSLSLGLNMGISTRVSGPIPLLNLTNPSNQTVSPPGMSFDPWSILIRFEDLGAPVATEKLWELILDGNQNAFLHMLSNGNIQVTIESAGTPKAYTFARATILNGSGDAAMCVAFTENDIVITANGVNIQTDNSVPAPVGTPTSLGIGQRFNATQTFSGDIFNFQYYNTRISNSLAVSLTVI